MKYQVRLDIDEYLQLYFDSMELFYFLYLLHLESVELIQFYQNSFSFDFNSFEYLLVTSLQMTDSMKHFYLKLK